MYILESDSAVIDGLNLPESYGKSENQPSTDSNSRILITEETSAFLPPNPRKRMSSSKFLNETLDGARNHFPPVKIEQQAPFKRKIYPDEIWLYRNPMTKDYVSSRLFFMCTFFAPSLVILLNFLYSRNRRDLGQGFLACTLAIFLSQFLTSLFKISVGRPRPDFVQRCFPDGVIGDFDNCTGDIRVVNEGRKSFPSGHSALTFTGLGFVFFYVAGKLNIFNQRGRGSAWRLLVAIAPLVASLEVAVSRTCDYHHHWQDVVVGSIMGLLVTYISYRTYFPSLFDQECSKPYPSGDMSVKIKTNGFIPVQNRASKK